MTLLKPSRLDRAVEKYQRRTARANAAKANARTARKAWRDLSAAVKRRDGGKCRVCGIGTSSTGNPEHIGAAHHIVFRSAGGKDDPETLIWTCQRCHDQVHRHLIEIDGTASQLHVELLGVAPAWPRGA